MNQPVHFQSGFSEVNGLQMYFERYGAGDPLVLIHGGGSTIQSNFGQVIPLLSKSHQIIAVELQAHGRTGDRGVASTFEQDADDVAALLSNLGMEQAAVLGFSNGATTTLQLAIRHPQLVSKMILCAPLAKRHGMPAWIWDFMNHASLENMPAGLQEAYLKVNPDPKGLQIMHDRDAHRMVYFQDISDELITGIKIPTLIINGDQDVILAEHVLELHRQIENARLVILPGSHGAYLGEITTIGEDFNPSNLVAVRLIEQFLR